MAVGPEAQKTAFAGYCDSKVLTVTENEQFCPPTVIEKEAVPAPDAVPVMVNVKLPLPLASVPAAKVAVRPVTPVELTLCAT
jgi:hypothetical protein